MSTDSEIIEGEVVGQEVEVRRSALATQDELTVDDMLAQVNKIQQVMAKVMKENEHYGVIPGTDKPTLLKPGAEKLCLLFRLDPEYDVKEYYDDDGHYTAQVKCVLYHSPSGNRIASGMGLCTSKEKKYGSRKASRVCPVCGKPAIIKGKAEYGGGWLCFKKKEGCGAKFADGDPKIESQPEGTVTNPDLPDTYNTVLKMACKRALVAAVLNGTAASDIFTQDMEDITVAAPSIPTIEPINGETLGFLQEGLNALDGDPLWNEATVVGNASRRFGRQIDSLGDLRESEGQQILTALRRASGE